MKLYDEDGNLIPLCYRCMEFEAFPDCSAWIMGQTPEHWKKMKASKCDAFGSENWWKVRNMGFDKPSDFKTFRKPPVKGKQNTMKGSKWGKEYA